jgi:NADH-quinone oxidoreductase subunit M
MNSGWEDWAISIATFLPLVGALVIAFTPRERDRLVRSLGVLFTAAALIVGVVMAVGFDYGAGHGLQFEVSTRWIPVIGARYHVGIDGISLPLYVLTLALSFLCAIYSYRFVPSPGRTKSFLALQLLLETGMAGTFIAFDLILFFVFWELVLVPMYFLIGIWGSANREYAAIKFFLYTLFGSVFMLLAFLGMYFRSNVNGAHTFDIVQLQQFAASGGFSKGFQLVAFVGVFLGFAIKVPMWPFHTWLPDAHVEAPTAGSIILAGVLLKLGGYGFLRYSIPLLPNAAMSFAPLIIALAVIAILYGALVAMVQPDLKKLVAYSSVSHMGFVMLGAFVFNTQGLQGSVFQMVSHGITTGALFLLVGVIYERTHDRQIAHMGGLNARLPRYAAIFGLFTFASIGLPGLSGFVGEFLVVLGAFQFNGYVAAATMLVVIASAVYMLWMFQRVFFTVPSDWARSWWPSLRDMSRSEWLALAPLIVLVVALGVYPAPVLQAIAAPVERIIDAVHGAGLTSFSLPW